MPTRRRYHDPRSCSSCTRAALHPPGLLDLASASPLDLEPPQFSAQAEFALVAGGASGPRLRRGGHERGRAFWTLPWVQMVTRFTELLEGRN
jgi:hypothetical protein